MCNSITAQASALFELGSDRGELQAGLQTRWSNLFVYLLVMETGSVTEGKDLTLPSSVVPAWTCLLGALVGGVGGNETWGNFPGHG